MKFLGSPHPRFLWLGSTLNLLPAIVTLIAAYGGCVNPDVTTLPALLAMTFPAWVALMLLLLAVDLIFWRRLSLIPLGTLLLCSGPIMANAPLNLFEQRPTPEQEKTSFTLMSYNVYGMVDFTESGVPYNPTAATVIASGADVVCAQEGDSTNPSPAVGLTQEQSDSLHALYPHRLTASGAALWSRYPLREVELRQPESEYSRFCGAMVNINGHETLIVSVHMQSIGLNSDDKELYYRLTEGEGKPHLRAVKRQLLSKLSAAFRERAQQARLLRQQIDSINPENVVIAGDFNDIPNSYAMNQLTDIGLRSAFTEAAHGPTVTYHANRFYFHIDHVLYRGLMRPVEFTRLKAPYSDHYPLLVKFVWEP